MLGLDHIFGKTESYLFVECVGHRWRYTSRFYCATSLSSSRASNSVMRMLAFSSVVIFLWNVTLNDGSCNFQQEDGLFSRDQGIWSYPGYCPNCGSVCPQGLGKLNWPSLFILVFHFLEGHVQSYWTLHPINWQVRVTMRSGFLLPDT